MPFLCSPDCTQTAAPCFSEDNLSKLVTVSPLFKTLQEIQQSLQQLTTDESHQHSHKGAKTKLSFSLKVKFTMNYVQCLAKAKKRSHSYQLVLLFNQPMQNSALL